MKKLSGGVVLALVVGACSSIAPVPIHSGEVCFRCRRVIVDTRIAAQAIDGGLVSNFRSAGCAAKYLVDHPNDTSAVFVTDYQTGKMFPAQRAFFVPTLNRDNGEKDYVAFVARSAADAEAFSRRTQWLTWSAVKAAEQAAERGN